MIYVSVELRCIYTDLNFGLVSIGTQCRLKPITHARLHNSTVSCTAAVAKTLQCKDIVVVQIK